MAAGGLGNLTVFLGLDAAEFDRGLTRSELAARRFGEGIGNGIKALVSSYGTLSSAAGTAFAFLNKQADAIAAYQDFADKIGATAAEVTKLQLAADLSGTAIDAVAASSIKLTTALTKSDDEAKGAAAALAAIGISAKDFKALDPVAQYESVAKALDGFADGAEKTAVATVLWGKSGAEILPFLKDLAEQGEQQVQLSEDQIAAADAYTKRIARQKSEISTLSKIVAAESIPAIEALTGSVTDAVKEFLGLDQTTKNLRDSQFIRDWAGNAAVFLGSVADLAVEVATKIRVLGNTLGGLAAAAVSVAQGEFKQAGQIMSMMREDNQRMLRALDGPGIADRVRARLAAMGAGGDAAGGNKPRINTAGLAVGTKAGGGGDDALKKQLDNELKLIQNAQKAEEELLRDRNKMLDLYNGENLLSFADYYAGRRTAAEESLRNQSALIDQEIAKLQAYQATAAKATDREAAQGKINDLLEKQAKLQREAATEGVVLGLQQQKSLRGLADTLQGVNASVMEFLGLSGEAARIRFDISNRDVRERLGTEKDADGIAQLDRLRQLTVAQADYNQRQQDSADIISRLQIQEERINTARNLGAVGELTALKQITEARKAAVAQQESEVLALEMIARASENPKLVLQAEQARAAFERLRAESDLVVQKFDTIFGDNLSRGLEGFINGTMSAKDAFKSFADGVVGDITRMVSQEISTSLFKGLLGGSGGVGSLISGLFGGGKAVGGDVSPGKFYEVNEQGPELFQRQGKTYLMTGGRGGRIVPNTGGGGGTLVSSPTFVMPSRYDRQTQGQVARESRRSLEKAQRLA